MKSFIIYISLLVSSIVFAQTESEKNTSRYYESIKSDPIRLLHFLTVMPKGGDLHTHKCGATFAENLFRYAANDHLCINKKTFVVYKDANCPPQNLLNDAIKNTDFRNAVINAWSMRNFSPQNETGHDHFFKTFDKFGLICDEHGSEVLTEIVKRAASAHEIYVELMDTPDYNASGKLGKKLGFDANFAVMRDRLLASHFADIVSRITQNLSTQESKMRESLHCNTNHPSISCRLKIRYLYQVLREQPPEMVFAQLLAGFETASIDSRVVGINMVQPEDGPISMRDYKLHMHMIKFLKNIYKNVKVSLHAGELTKEIVPREGLTFHINDAVRVAHADRIGHGVDIANEDKMKELLQEMAAKNIMVEINLISNAYILQVTKSTHPFTFYMYHNVPVALSTDDEGVNRSTLSAEYKNAAMSYDLSYLVLKKLARNSIAYSFLPGEKLWQNNQYLNYAPACAKDFPSAKQMSTGCKLFLDQNEKAAMQWQLEKQFHQFESQF